MTSFSLAHPQIWKGVWSKPGSADKIPGTLTLDPQRGLNLELFSCGFDPLLVSNDIRPSQPNVTHQVISINEQSRNYEVIHGRSKDTFITLFDVSLISSTSPNWFEDPSCGQSSFNVSIAVIGLKLDSKDESVIREAKFGIDHLSKWLGPSDNLVFEPIFGADQVKRISSQLYLHPMQGPWLGFIWDDNIDIDFPGGWLCQPTEKNAYSNRIRYEESRKARFRSYKPLTVGQTLALGKRLCSLISISTDLPCDIHSIQITAEDPSEDAALLFKRRLPPPNDDFVHHRTGPYFGADDLDPISFLRVMEKWGTLSNQLSAPIALLEYISQDTAMTIETEVLLSCTMLESFHKGQYGSASSSAVEGLKECGVKNPKDHHLRTRAADSYFRAKPAIIDDLIPNWKRWSELLTGSRNKIAHEAHIPPASLTPSLAAAKMAQVLCKLLLLQEIGIPIEILEKNAPKTRSFESASNGAFSHFPSGQKS